MSKITEVENKRRFTISLVASIMGVFASFILVVIGKRGDSIWANLVMIMGYVALVSMIILLFEVIRLWKKNKFHE